MDKVDIYLAASLISCTVICGTTFYSRYKRHIIPNRIIHNDSVIIRPALIGSYNNQLYAHNMYLQRIQREIDFGKCLRNLGCHGIIFGLIPISNEFISAIILIGLGSLFYWFGNKIITHAKLEYNFIEHEKLYVYNRYLSHYDTNN